MADCGEFGDRDAITHSECRQHRFGVVFTAVFVEFFVHRAVTRESNRGAARGEFAVSLLSGVGCGGQAHDQGDAGGVAHL